MSKREEIIQLADTLIRQKGYNAFSFYEISDKVGIKTASIHYHFPAKSDLGIAVVDLHIKNLNGLIVILYESFNFSTCINFALSHWLL